MAPRKKSEWREVALLNALCPGLLSPCTPGKSGYEKFIGVWLNRADLLNQMAGILFTGMSYANSLDDIPGEIFEALCSDQATAFERMCQTNSARTDIRFKRDNAPGATITRSILG